MHVRLVDIDMPGDAVVAEWDEPEWDVNRDPKDSYEVNGETWDVKSHGMPIPGQWITDVVARRRRQ